MSISACSHTYVKRQHYVPLTQGGWDEQGARRLGRVIV